VKHPHNVLGVAASQLKNKPALGICFSVGLFLHAIRQTQQNNVIAGSRLIGGLVVDPAGDRIGGESGEYQGSKQQTNPEK